jgi:aldose sugar dehydrogenase
MKNLLISSRLFVFFILSFLPLISAAQFFPAPLGNGPWSFDTFEQGNLEVSVVARGINEPIGMVFIPGTASEANTQGDILVTERRTGFVRLYRNGELLSEPVGDLKSVLSLQQLFDLNLHPQFADNGLLYFTWIKQEAHPDGSDSLWLTTAIAKGRWNGNQVVDIEEVFEADAWASHIGGASTRGMFLPDGTYIFGSSHRVDRESPQRLDTHIGKTLRINDDGSSPPDNPFYANEGVLPEIFSWGNRSVMDFAVHPETGAVWELENGPQGGDEVNILRPGGNYGWPVVTYGRDYDGTHFNDIPWVEGTERPEVFWVPSITVAGMTFYTGDAFPNWKNNLFVTSMMEGRIAGTGHLERVVFNENGETRRESMFSELGQRIRYVTQGPDDLLYMLVDHSDGVILKIAPNVSAAEVLETLHQDLTQLGLSAPELFTSSDCLVCHKVNEGFVGPSFVDIAAKYESDAMTLLVDSILSGGVGNWGDVQMTPHPNLTTSDARAMVDQILGLTNQ